MLCLRFSTRDDESRVFIFTDDLESKCSRISELEASLAELENQVITLTANQREKQEVKVSLSIPIANS